MLEKTQPKSLQNMKEVAKLSNKLFQGMFSDCFMNSFIGYLKKLDPGGKLLKKYFVEIPCISSPVKYNKHAPLKCIHKI